MKILIILNIIILIKFVTPNLNVNKEANGFTDIDDEHMHPDLSLKATVKNRNILPKINENEYETEYWKSKSVNFLLKRLQQENNLNTNKAKNIIYFLGDGMSLQTVAATRMYMGGEELELSFEKFPHFGLSKTYCVDRQVSDSACTATAYLSGVKANYGTMGLTAAVKRYDCIAGLDESTHTPSIMDWAQADCKATGFVTTSKVTHATPAGLYAHIANRYWENDQNLLEDMCDPNVTMDIAKQLIYSDVGKKFKVILGGGRAEFRDKSRIDEEGEPGWRGDGKDLINEWLLDHQKNGNAKFIWNKSEMKSIDLNEIDYLLGLFEADHCMYNIDIYNQQLENHEPSLSEMTEMAIRMLSKDKNGYVLFVESARIDMAHHDTQARRALDETREFSKTIELARMMTSEEDTLIVVTADHAHVMSYNGYSYRGTDILGTTTFLADDGLPYTILSYANGMGYYNTYKNDTNNPGSRLDITNLNFNDPNLQYLATVPRDSETHGGDDVGVYASGPQSHLFVGNYEQNNIPLLMAHVAKIGAYTEKDTPYTCSGVALKSLSLVFIIVFSLFFIKLNAI